MISALEGDEWSAARPGCTLPPGKTTYPFYRRLGRTQGRSGQARKISPKLGFDPWPVQPVDSRYNDWATRPILLTLVLLQKALSVDIFTAKSGKPEYCEIYLGTWCRNVSATGHYLVWNETCVCGRQENTRVKMFCFKEKRLRFIELTECFVF
jgi:hypothetical protein